jgi:hypothetical protein
MLNDRKFDIVIAPVSRDKPAGSATIKSVAYNGKKLNVKL